MGYPSSPLPPQLTGDFAFPVAIEGLKYFTSIFKYWTFSLFYVISELFGSVGVSVLFWQLANEIIPVDQAKVIARHYLNFKK